MAFLVLTNTHASELGLLSGPSWFDRWSPIAMLTPTVQLILSVSVPFFSMPMTCLS